MRYLISILCLSATLLFCTSTPAISAELRVLLRFDASGHHVETLFRTPRSKSLTGAQGPVEATRVLPDVEALVDEVEPGSASLVWLDEQGYLISVSTAPDPRVSHSPAHIAGVNESRVSSQSGAWLVNGPAEAARLLILLPNVVSPALAREQWDVFL